MKLPPILQTRYGLSIAVQIVILLSPLCSFSQTFFGVSGAPADNSPQAGTTVTITPPASMAAGDLVIIYAHFRSLSGTPSISNAGGQAWNTETTGAATNQIFGVFWCRFNGTWASSPIVSGGTNTIPLSAIMYVYRPTNSSNFWGIHVGAANSNSSTTTASITGITTTVPNTVTMAFWSVPAPNTWSGLSGAGWSQTGLNAQYRNTTGSGQSHTAAYTILSAPGTVQAVSQNQPSGQTQSTRKTIISWYELPPPPVPSNDDCTGAVSLPINANCNKVWGTVVGSTPSGTPISTGCTGTAGYDVWYKFVATTTAAINITTADIGSNFTNRRIQLFNGSCGLLTPTHCTASGSLSVSGLTVGNTYYIRLFSSDTDAPVGSGDFSICLTTAAANVGPRFGNSYVNVTKKTTGGVVEPGDILEIRMTINHTSGTIYNMRYLDSVPTNTQMLTGATDKISVITNEGIAIQNYTPAPGDDAATYIANPPAGNYQIRMNLGFGTTTTPSPTIGVPPNTSTTESASATGQAVAGTNLPKGGGGILFATSFRVRVTGVVGDTITLGAGKFIYKSTAGGPDIVLTATPYKILITTPMSLCANATGVNMSQEFGGTFGTGTTLNRSMDLAFPIPGYTLVKASATQAVGDGQYAIVKNMSPRSGTNRDADRNPTSTFGFPDQRSGTYRMFTGFWDIDGDHTGTTNAIGNIPQADGVNAGYMLMVNADFVASETYRQTLNNLCPNTYYEFSAWFRNICPNCGIDYATGSNYTPRTPGVLPNLTFSLDGVDRYNTGEIPYMNVNNNSGGWVKKGFVFITGPTQTSATFSIRNNSQGGGGNDWAMDDIAIATCLPDMTYTPTLNPTVCMTNTITINNTVRSYFSNYNHYKWQRSTDGGTTWLDIPGETGSATPTSVSGQWEFPTAYVVPPAYSNLSNNGDRYRLIVATTAANLNSPTCLVTDGVSQVNLNVIDCGTPLKTDLLSFNGKLSTNHSILSWTTSREEKPVRFFIEKSTDGIHFTRIGTVESYNNPAAENNTYSFTDPVTVTGKTLYRIAISSNAVIIKYSRTIQLGSPVESFKTEVKTNPFDKDLYFDVTIDKNAKIEVLLLNATGNVVKQKSYTAYTGINNYSLPNTESLAAGVYILKVQHKDKMITRKVIKN